MDERCDLLCLDAPRAEAIRLALPGDEAARVVADREKALSDPTRLVLAEALEKGGELCVCDLAWITARTQALVSHHLKVLRSADLVSSRRDGKLVMYSLTESGRSLLAAVASGEVAVERP